MSQDTTLPPPPGQERAAFEAFCFERGLMSASHGLMSVSSHCDTAWLAWQARAAIAAQAPQPSGSYLSWAGFHPSGDEPSIREAQRLIHEAGLVPYLRQRIAEQSQQALGVPPRCARKGCNCANWLDEGCAWDMDAPQAEPLPEREPLSQASREQLWQQHWPHGQGWSGKEWHRQGLEDAEEAHGIGTKGGKP